jgi:lipid-binding SYLF domain-containing protein
MSDLLSGFFRKPFVVASLLLVAVAAHAATREEQRVTDATNVLDQLLRIPERAIPPALLSNAYGVAVIPDVVKVGFGIGARRGKGILVIRQDENSWSNPAFITMTGGSIGWQAGAQSTDVVLVFRTRESIEHIAEGKFTLGADASVAAGPVGRHTEIATDLRFESEVVSYSRSRGLFAGVALEGAGLTMDRKANAKYYGSSGMTPEKIFESSPTIAPGSANDLIQILTAQTADLPTQPGLRTDGLQEATGEDAQNDARVDEEDESSGVRTFGVPGPRDDIDDSGY